MVLVDSKDSEIPFKILAMATTLMFAYDRNSLLKRGRFVTLYHLFFEFVSIFNHINQSQPKKSGQIYWTNIAVMKTFFSG